MFIPFVKTWYEVLKNFLFLLLAKKREKNKNWKKIKQMPFISLVNDVRAQTLFEFNPEDKIQILRERLSTNTLQPSKNIHLYYHDKPIDDNDTFEKLGIVNGNHILFLIDGEGLKNKQPTRCIIEMLKQGITYKHALRLLSKHSYDVSESLKYATEHDKEFSGSDSESYSDDDDASDFVMPTYTSLIPHKRDGSNNLFGDSSTDFAEEIISENFKSSESTVCDNK